MVTAEVTNHNDMNGEFLVETSTGHAIQYGGEGGDGFCYRHQSYLCSPHLTPDEREAVGDAMTEYV